MSQIANWMLHSIIGNDTHPAVVAAVRAFLGAFITGGLGFLAVWQSTEEVKVLVTAGVTPFLSYLAIRLGLEGIVDVRKMNSKK